MIKISKKNIFHTLASEINIVIIYMYKTVNLTLIKQSLE